MSPKMCCYVGSVLFAWVALAVSPLFAGLVGIEFDTAGWSNYGQYTMGYEFKPTQDILVTHLGVYDHGGNGLVGGHGVAIWKSSNGNQMTPTTTVTTAAPLTGHFRYVALGTPVLLEENIRYRVGAEMFLNSSGDYYGGDGTGFSSGPDITYVVSVTNNATGPTMPNSSWANKLYAGNFLYTPAATIPEPSSLVALIGMGAGGLLVYSRRRRKK